MNQKLLILPVASGLLVASAAAQTAPVTSAPAAVAAPNTGGTPAAPSRPQTVLKPFAQFGGFSFSGYLRSRVENYNFFEPAAALGGDGSYTFTGHHLRVSALKASPKLDIQFDLQQQLLTNLPNDASFQPLNNLGAPAGPRVPLGQGGNYFAANGNQDGALNVKQAFVRFKGALGKGSAVRLGRFEFNDGAETVNANPTLNFLKTQRISQRLIGNFGFTHTGRAFDGGQVSLPVAGGNVTVVGARPTEGVFQLEANDNIDATNFLYGAYTKPMDGAEARVFGMMYQDGRESPKSIKTDNRPLAARVADDGEVEVYTLGANYIKTMGPVDLLAWGAIQGGDWGGLDHAGNAFALEAGYQFKTKMRPWLRAGYYRGSGDDNAADGKHKTFFTPLPTPRLYARFPFYNQMNSEDLFAQFILRPTPKLNLRSEFHSLRLANSNDLYYFGGGAFQDSGFGIGGRPSGGNSKLANVIDISADYTISPKSSIGLYFAYASGGAVIRNSFAGKDHATLGFLEFTRKF
ncbi:MAG TPA: alginate export family protein [Abditibacterium sp.]